MFKVWDKISTLSIVINIVAWLLFGSLLFQLMLSGGSLLYMILCVLMMFLNSLRIILAPMTRKEEKSFEDVEMLYAGGNSSEW